MQNPYMNIKKLSYYILFLILSPANLFAASNNLGAELPLYSIIPFLGLLLSIAVMPLLRPLFWHHNYGKISAFWAILFLVPFSIFNGIDISLYYFLHTILLEYFPFIIILLSLYTISGGIHISGKFSGTPQSNVFIIIIGTLLASWVGTTGASILLIRPLLNANKWRKYSVHTVIFFIFLVSNIGGALTPLGDPPLFLGFLQGVSFFWTTKNLFIPMLIISTVLFIIYYFIDTYYYKKEDIRTNEEYMDKTFSINGKLNMILLLCVVFTVLISGIWNLNINLDIFNIHLKLQNIIRDFLLLLFTFISWQYSAGEIRIKNHFTWFPIKEVAKLFAGIFITIIPAILILQSGTDGALYPLINLVSDNDGSPFNLMYFWLTGILSAFLDNAPTYLVFFNLASSSSMGEVLPAEYLMNEIPITLIAISAGAVFMGAISYIGNAPNFMIKSIAEENKIKMPSFFGYMVWSILILIPIFIIFSIICF